MFERDLGKEFRRRGVADAHVMLELDDLFQKLQVLCHEPAHAQSRKAVGLGHHTERHALFIVVGHPVALFAVHLKALVDLVGKEVEVMAAADVAQALDLGVRKGVARGVVG